MNEDKSSDESLNLDSDEEDASMIPDEKPEDGAAGVGATTMGDDTAMEIDLIEQIEQMENQE